MDSSARYKKFTISQDAKEEGEESRKERKRDILILGLLVVAIVAISVTCVVAIGVGVGVSVSTAPQQEETSGLNVITVTLGKLEGEYYGSAGGIHFLSTVNGSDFLLTITTTSGEVIIIARRPQESPMAMMSLNDTDFLVMETPNSLDYIIPKNNTELMKSLMERGPNVDMNEVMSMVDSTNVNETLHCVIEHLVMRSESVLITEAAKALGGLGINGTEYPAVLPFYMLALRLANGRDGVQGDQNTEPKQPRQRRSSTCTRNGNQYTCPSGKCPFPKYGNRCFGMCGKGCSCWSFLCGDCCVHRGCLEHDQCCADNGFYSLKCLLIHHNLDTSLKKEENQDMNRRSNIIITSGMHDVEQA